MAHRINGPPVLAHSGYYDLRIFVEHSIRIFKFSEASKRILLFLQLNQIELNTTQIQIKTSGLNPWAFLPRS